VPPSPPGSVPEGDLGLEVGDRVTHDQYGLGKVIALEGQGRNAVAKVDFGEPGVKRLLLRFAPMVKL
jgi:DNA helicase-2/ATP-dependent DNA helicase PcrA